MMPTAASLSCSYVLKPFLIRLICLLHNISWIFYYVLLFHINIIDYKYIQITHASETLLKNWNAFSDDIQIHTFSVVLESKSIWYSSGNLSF